MDDFYDLLREDAHKKSFFFNGRTTKMGEGKTT